MTDDEIRQQNIDAALIELQLVVDDLRAAFMSPDHIKDKLAVMLGALPMREKRLPWMK